MDITTIVEISVAAAAFLAVVAAGYVKYIAPKTKTKKDDEYVGKIADIASDVTEFAGRDKDKEK